MQVIAQFGAQLDGVIPYMDRVGRCTLKVFKSRVDSTWFQCLKLKYDKLLSSFAFNFNLRRYNMAVQFLGSCAMFRGAAK